MTAAHELTDQRGGTAGAVQVLRHETAGGREARDHRRAAPDRGELVERQLDAGLVRECEQVQDPVRRPAACRDSDHRIQQRTAIEEAARGQLAAGETSGQRARALGSAALGFELVGGDQAVADRRDPEAVEGHRHRVRREVSGAGAGAGARDPLELVELGAGDQAALLRSEALPDILDRHLSAAQAPGAHRPAVEHDGGLVDPCERHERGGNGLVAADEADERVEVVRMHHQLDRVGDHLA